MKIFKTKVNIRISGLILIILIICNLVAWFSYIRYDGANVKLEAILASLIAGLFVAIIQFLIQFQEFRASERVNKLKIVDVLLDRDNRNYYERVLGNAKESIDVMGVSGSRLLEHFADTSDEASDNSKIILTRMTSGVKVRILMPNPNELLDDAEKNKAEAAKGLYDSVKKLYPDNFEIKYFDHIPTHSIFRVDDESIVGPIFPDVKSKHTPAIHAHNSSPFVKKYIQYFETEWKQIQ